jgi:hypothetical protein
MRPLVQYAGAWIAAVTPRSLPSFRKTFEHDAVVLGRPSLRVTYVGTLDFHRPLQRRAKRSGAFNGFPIVIVKKWSLSTSQRHQAKALSPLTLLATI